MGRLTVDQCFVRIEGGNWVKRDVGPFDRAEDVARDYAEYRHSHDDYPDLTVVELRETMDGPVTVIEVTAKPDTTFIFQAFAREPAQAAQGGV